MYRALCLLFPLLVGCPKSTPTYPTDSGYCDAAQANLLKLQCKDDAGHLLGGPNNSGMSYGDRCRQAESNGVPMAPQCISVATSCAQVDPCLQTQ